MSKRDLPMSIEAEEGVLGSLLIDPEAIDQVAPFLAPQDFYRQAHRTLYETILALWARQEPADFLTLCDELERQGKLEDVGGAATITSLINGVPTSSNVEYYGRLVAQKALFRRLIHAAGQIAALAYEEETDALEQAEQLLFQLNRQQVSELSSVKSILTRCMQTLDTLQSLHGTSAIIGVPTNFKHLDMATGGLQKADLIVLAARPGTGKTSFALNVAAHAVYTHHRQVALFLWR